MSELDQYDYHLPKELIAQSPTVCRTDARLLVVHRRSGVFDHRHVRDLPDILLRHDCLVVNDTRALPPIASSLAVASARAYFAIPPAVNSWLVRLP